ncbi:MAG TPA: hypothetical protein PK760_16435, partial [Flavobacteriales bacterium]|nr:hypothetical protein [Flavobacteriales bacterium]
MRIVTLSTACTLTLLSAAQTTLFSEQFETTPAFTLNTTDAQSVTGVANTWLVNNVYTGGDGVADCLGIPLDFNIPNTPAQPAGITSANGNYLHTASLVAIQNSL